jgi:hypothetical protein
LYHYGQISGDGAAALSFGNAAGRPLPRRSFGTRSRPSVFRDVDLVTDLGLRIGSGQWFRGLATCGALCYSAISFAPGFEPMAGAAAAPLSETQF